MFKAIIFDFDGTLADSWEVINLALRRIAARYGYAILSQAELEELKRLPVKERFKKMGLPAYRIPELLKDVNMAFVEKQDSLRPFPGAREILLALAERGFKLYVLSTNTREVIGNNPDHLEQTPEEILEIANEQPGT